MNDKTQTIVQNKIKLEKIKFKGKIITREVLVKEWDIPDVITTDIGYQLMFGNSPTVNRKAPESKLTEVQLKDGSMIMINDDNVLCIEVFKEE